MTNLIEFIDKYLGHKFAAAILFFLLGMGIVFYASEYVLTTSVWANEKEHIIDQIEQGDRNIRMEILYGQKINLERELWDYQDKYDETGDQKWLYRIEKTEEQLHLINEKIDNL